MELSHKKCQVEWHHLKKLGCVYTGLILCPDLALVSFWVELGFHFHLNVEKCMRLTWAEKPVP